MVHLHSYKSFVWSSLIIIFNSDSLKFHQYYVFYMYVYNLIILYYIISYHIVLYHMIFYINLQLKMLVQFDIELDIMVPY